ncbi:hypothetical protein ABW19_dt0201198 [Dactylella cylindrospora]|nr:hypothetical protein ABW19_dt0201198 [Dactylella cylindrospora]
MKAFTFLSALALALGVAQAAPYAHLVARAPPGVPSGQEARSKLATLRVAASGAGTGYNRDLFPHWKMQQGECNTREVVLQRDGNNVQIDNLCRSTSGSWKCPYSGGTYSLASDIDIDHMVPLKNAWISGASNWTTTRRGEFANDLKGPQLWATKDSVNQQKSDSSPDKWKPSLTSFHCTYASAWIQVKSTWGLTITSAEKAALTEMLDTCTTTNIFC